MNTEIAFLLLYPSVHLLLRTSKLAAPRLTAKTAHLVHPYQQYPLVSVHRIICSLLLSVEQVHRQTLKIKYSSRPSWSRRAARTSAVGSEHVDTRPSSPLVDFAEASSRGAGPRKFRQCLVLLS